MAPDQAYDGAALSTDDLVRLRECPFCGHDEIEDWGECTWSRPAKWMYCTLCGARGPRLLQDRAEDGDA